MVIRVQMKTVNFDGGNIYYPNAIVDMENNKANYLLGLEDVILNGGALSTPPSVPVRIDNRPGTKSRVDQILGSGDGLALVAADNIMKIKHTATPANDYSGTPGAKLTTTRNLAASYRDSDGLIKLAPINTLRRDFDLRLGGAPGYLIEEARTNVLLNSVLAGGPPPTSWSSFISTGTLQAVASNYGNADGAIAYQMTVAATRIAWGPTTNPSVNASTVYVWSILVEAVSGLNYNQVISSVNLPAGSTSAIYSNGVLIPNGSVPCTTGILEVVITVGTTAGTVGLRVGAGVGSNSTGSVKWSRPQFEQGSFRTSFIPTTTGSVTRPADLVTLAGTLFPLNQAEGTLYAKAVHFGLATTQNNDIAVDNGTTSRLARLSRSAASQGLFQLSENTTQCSLNTTGLINNLVVAKQAGVYKVNDFAYAALDEAIQTDLVGAIPSIALTTLRLGHIPGDTQNLNGWILEAMYKPIRISNTDLDALA